MDTTDGITRMLDRQAGEAEVRAAHDCPSCEGKAGGRCFDRWGHPTSLIHSSRAALAGFESPYLMA